MTNKTELNRIIINNNEENYIFFFFLEHLLDLVR